MKLKRFSILILIASSCLGISKCPNGVPPFKWDPEVWGTDSRTESIVRMQGEELIQIKCSDPRFDTKICISKSDLRKAKEAYFEVVNQCEKWKTPKDKENFVDFFEQQNVIDLLTELSQ